VQDEKLRSLGVFLDAVFALVFFNLLIVERPDDLDPELVHSDAALWLASRERKRERVAHI
jgi:hypothetical protein